MNGEHIEYCIQRRNGHSAYGRENDSVWRIFTKTYADKEKVKGLMKTYREAAKKEPRYFGNVEYRIAVRTVTDWCEVAEGGEA